MLPPKPEFRPLVRALTEGQWREPVVVAHLGDVSPDFHVEGRRKDGTIKGKRLVRRFFWNLIRIPFEVVARVLLTFAGGEIASGSFRSGLVRGPENARALGFVDTAKAAKNPWLVFTPSHVGLVDTGVDYGTPAENGPPQLIWHEAAPNGPRVNRLQRVLVWPDGSEFHPHLSAAEREAFAQG